MSQETRYQRNPDFIYRKIVDESVLIPIHQDIANMDSIFTLNGIGAFIWEQLEQPTTQASLQAAILDEYDANQEVLLADLENFLGQMKEIDAICEV